MDLNKEIAEKVMGWRNGLPMVKCFHSGMDVEMIWNPLEDLNQCFEVVDAMERKGFGFSMDSHTKGRGVKWCAVFHFSDYKEAGVANAGTPNEAILNAALKTPDMG